MGGSVELALRWGEGSRRFSLERALRRWLVVRCGDERLVFSAETDRVRLPAGTAEVTLLLGEDLPLLTLELEPSPAIRGPVWQLSPFETRYLAAYGRPHPPAAPGAGPHGLRTDLHTHLAGCLSGEDLVQTGTELGLSYPAPLLAEAGVHVQARGPVPLAELSPRLRARLAARLSLPLDRPVTFADLEDVYRLRAPITKSRAAFPAILGRIARDYAAMGLSWVELSTYDILDGERLACAHRLAPTLERETGVRLRFLVALSRHDDLEWDLDALDRLDQLLESRLIAGVDFMGQETNSTHSFSEQLRAVGALAARRRPGLTVRVHAGENPAFPENVRAVVEILRPYPVRVRVGHGLYGVDEGTLALLREADALVEFNLNSNLALNNLQGAGQVPLLRTLRAGVPCVLGTDGYGIYLCSPDRELQAARLAGLDEEGLAQIRASEAAFLEAQEAVEARSGTRILGFEPPEPLAPRHWRPELGSAREQTREARRAALRARLDGLGVPLLDPPGVDALLAGRRVISVAGAWRGSWEALGPARQARIESVLTELVAGLDPQTTVLVLGGTASGVEGIAAREARRRGVPTLGTLVAEAPLDRLAPDLLGHATVIAERLHDKLGALYPLLRRHGALCLFFAGGHIVSDEIRAAGNLRVPLMLMAEVGGASGAHAAHLPERAFTEAAQVLAALTGLSPWPSTRDPYWHLGPNPVVDVVLLRPGGRGEQVLLIRRDDDAAAEPGAWALPGGFQATDAPRGAPWTPGAESDEEAAIRELQEETGLDLGGLTLVRVGEFEGEGRDPRDTAEAWSRSHAFALRLPPALAGAPVAGGDDAADARWFDLDALPERLAFDHARILQAALGRLGGS